MRHMNIETLVRPITQASNAYCETVLIQYQDNNKPIGHIVYYPVTKHMESITLDGKKRQYSQIENAITRLVIADLIQEAIEQKGFYNIPPKTIGSNKGE